MAEKELVNHVGQEFGRETVAMAAVCPLLGNGNGPGDAAALPSESNYCYQSRVAVPTGLIHQEHYCLSSNYHSCPVFQKGMPPAEPVRVADIPVAVIPRSVLERDGRDDSIFLPVDSGSSGELLEIPVVDVFDWAIQEEPGLTVFDPNVHVKIVPKKSHRHAKRNFLIVSLIFLGLVLLGGWLWLTFLSQPGTEQTARSGLLRLPTLVPTAQTNLLGWLDSAGLNGTTGDATTPVPPTQTPNPVPGAAENQSSDPNLESVALTATALFVVSTPATCTPPTWWVRYVVQPADTVEALALARGITPEEIVLANCLNTDMLASVVMIYLPPEGFITTSPEATAPSTPVNTLPPVPTALPATLPVIQFPTTPPLILPTATVSVVIISTIAPPAPPPTSPPPPPPPPQPTNPPPPPPPTATAPVQPTVSSGPPPTATPPPLP